MIPNQQEQCEHFIKMGEEAFGIGDYVKAKVHFLKALDFNPNSVKILHNLGTICYHLKTYTEAQKYFENVLDFEPRHLQSLFNLANIYEKSKQHTIAKKTYYRCITDLVKQISANQSHHLQLNYNTIEANALARYISICLKGCDWDALNKLLPLVNAITENQIKGQEKVSLSPLDALVLIQDPTLQKALVEQKSNKMLPDTGTFQYLDKNKKTHLNIGYLSPDFNFHPVGLLINTLFSNHDREKFTVYGFSLNTFNDEMTETIQNSCDEFIDLSNLAFKEAAKAIHHCNIDILIDLCGYTASGKPKILSFQPAPIQAQFLGYPGTMGAPFIQYYFTLKAIFEEKDCKHFTETMVLLPNSHISTEALDIPEQKPKRADYGLPEDAIVYFSYNNPYRLKPELLDTWLSILETVDNSVLWFNQPVREIEKNIRSYITAHSKIDQARIIFCEGVPFTVDWRHQLADIGLDTTTLSSCTSNVLFMNAGVPCITLKGPLHQQRTGASVCYAANMPELVTYSLDEYKQLAIKLGQDQSELSQIKQKIMQTQHNMPLFQPEQYIQYLEKAYFTIWDDYCKGRNPQFIEIPKDV